MNDAVFGAAGRLKLGPTLGSGGEGVVYELGADRAAKLYSALPDARQQRKLEVLIDAANADLRRISAWPDMLLRDRAGAVVGFAMPKIVDRVPLHRLFAPTARKAIAPDRHWGFLAHVGRNIAAAVATVHAAGALVGDLNDRNILVSLGTGQVSLIDVDSFQIAAAGVTYASAVGVDLYLPPELQGAELAVVERTPDHDNFALAVLIFRLVMMGRHPYGGVNLPRDVDDSDLAKIIRQLPYAYGERASELGIRRPPQSVALGSLTSELAVLFERAFERRDGRPAPDFWVRALERFQAELVPCRQSPMHRFVRDSGPCPWCALEGDGYVAFAGVTHAGGIRTYDTLPYRRWLASLAPPVTEPAIAPERPVPQTPSRRATWLDWAVWYACLCVVVVVVGVLFAVHVAVSTPIVVLCIAASNLRSQRPTQRRKRKVASLRARLHAADDAWRTSLAAWRGPASVAKANEALAEFRALLEFVEHPRVGLAERMRGLELRKRAVLLDAHLERFAIADAKLGSINADVRANLASFGITTAAGVRRLEALKIPSVGRGRQLILTDWRDRLARRFAYDPAAPLPADVVKRAEAEHDAALRDALQRLPTLRATANALFAQARAERERLDAHLAAAAEDVGKARRAIAAIGETW